MNFIATHCEMILTNSARGSRETIVKTYIHALRKLRYATIIRSYD
jgi:hypothetical protein